MASEYNVKLLKRVNVSGAFHTKLMLPASIALREYLASVCFVVMLFSSGATSLCRKPTTNQHYQCVPITLVISSRRPRNRQRYTCLIKYLFFSSIVQAFADCLAQQVSHTVKWEQTLHAIYDKKLYTTGDIKPRTYEVGPGNQLCAVLKR